MAKKRKLKIGLAYTNDSKKELEQRTTYPLTNIAE